MIRNPRVYPYKLQSFITDIVIEILLRCGADCEIPVYFHCVALGQLDKLGALRDETPTPANGPQSNEE